MKITTKILTLAALSSFSYGQEAPAVDKAPAAEAPLAEAKLLMVQNAGTMPEMKDAYRVRPMGYKEGIKFYFLVQAEKMIAFKSETLKADGWKFGSFPRVSEDGKTATFSILKVGNYLGKGHEIKVNGSVQVMTGDTPVTKELTLKAGADPIEVAGCNITLALKKEGFQGTGVKMLGKFENIKQVELKVDGKLVKSRGWSTMQGKRIYGFKDIKDNAEVVITYWPNTKLRTINFSR